MFIAALAFAVHAQQSRQEAVAAKGASVMPFDLTRTQHFFDDTPTGGVETVTANDPRDVEQIELIRSHLKVEQHNFARGDFSDPRAIHGIDMPGLKTLASAGRKLNVSYAEVTAGARITFASRDATIVRAIHEWFAAQRSDHGAHGHMHR